MRTLAPLPSTTLSQVLNPTTESKRAVKQSIRYSKAGNTLVFVLNRAKWFKKGLLELAGRRPRLGRRFGNTPECYGISLRCTDRNDVQPKSEADCNQSQFSRSRVQRRLCLRRRTVVTHRTLRGTLQRFSSSRDGFRLGKTQSFYSAGDQADSKHIEIRCLAIQLWVREKIPSVSRVDTKNETADLFTKHLDGLRTQSLAKKLGLWILECTNGTNVITEEWWRLRAFEQCFQSSRCVSILSFSS